MQIQGYIEGYLNKEGFEVDDEEGNIFNSRPLAYIGEDAERLLPKDYKTLSRKYKLNQHDRAFAPGEEEAMIREMLALGHKMKGPYAFDVAGLDSSKPNVVKLKETRNKQELLDILVKTITGGEAMAINPRSPLLKTK
jgi:hypothetical protein